MITTPQAALAEVERFGLPPIFRAILTQSIPADSRVAQCLGARFPAAYFSGPDAVARQRPEVAGICPLWESWGTELVGRLPDGTFVYVVYEGLFVETLGRSYSQFITSLLIDAAETWNDELAPLAAELGYQYLDELRAILDAWESEEDEVRLEQFRESLTD